MGAWRGGECPGLRGCTSVAVSGCVAAFVQVVARFPWRMVARGSRCAGRLNSDQMPFCRVRIATMKHSRGHGYSALSMTVVEVSAGTGGAAWSDLMTPYSDRCERAAWIACDVVLVRGRVLTGVVAERRRLGAAVDSDAGYRAISVGGRPASGPPASGTEPRWVGPPRAGWRPARAIVRAGGQDSRGVRRRVEWACRRCVRGLDVDPEPPGSLGEPPRSRLLDIMWIIGETANWDNAARTRRPGLDALVAHRRAG